MKPNETLLILRQNLIRLFKQYEYIVMPFIKFIIVFSILTTLSSSVGYTGVLSRVEILLFLSLVGTFLPEKWMVLGFVILIPFYVIMANLMFGIISFVFLWVLYLLFMRLFPKESLLIVVTILCFNLGIEMLLPILAGLFGSYVCVVAIIIGVFIRFVMPQFAQVVQPGASAKDELLSTFTSLMHGGIQSIIGDKTMLSIIVVFFIVFSLVYIIRKQAVDYASYLAIGIGVVMNLAGFILADLFLGVQISMVRIIITTVLAAIAAIIAQFFSKVLDYQRAEVVSFEDEENYYYVKVVPKINVNTNSRKVKRVYNSKFDNTQFDNTQFDNTQFDNKKFDNKEYISSFTIPSNMTNNKRNIND